MTNQSARKGPVYIINKNMVLKMFSYFQAEDIYTTTNL